MRALSSIISSLFRMFQMFFLRTLSELGQNQPKVR